MKKITNPLIKFSLLATFAAVALALYYFNIGCLFKAVFGADCIACGLTRAWLSVFRLDFKSAFIFNPMFWSVPVLVVFLLFDGKVFQNRVLNAAVPIGIFIGFLIAYVIRWFS